MPSAFVLGVGTGSVKPDDDGGRDGRAENTGRQPAVRRPHPVPATGHACLTHRKSRIGGRGMFGPVPVTGRDAVVPWNPVTGLVGRPVGAGAKGSIGRVAVECRA